LIVQDGRPAIEIRGKPFEQEGDQESEEQPPEAETHIQIILDASRNFNFMK